MTVETFVRAEREIKRLNLRISELRDDVRLLRERVDVAMGGVAHFATTSVVSFAEAHNMLSDTHGDTAPYTVLRGSLIYGNATPSWDGLDHPGAASYHLQTDAQDVLWSLNITIADGSWVGGGAAAGRIVFDLTADPDQIEITAADLVIATSGRGIIHVDGVSDGQFLRANGTRYIPDTLDVADLTDLAYAAPTITLGTAHAAGVANTVIRSDAVLAVFDVTVPTTIAVGDTAATGSVAFAARRDHTHGITTSSNPGAAASILASAADGGLQLLRLGIGADPDVNNRIRLTDGASIGDTGQPLITYDASNNYWEITGANVGIGTATPGELLHVYSASADVWMKAQSTNLDSQAGVVVQNDARTWTIGINANDQVQIRDITASENRFVIDSNGDAAFGTSSTTAGERLKVYEASDDAVIRVESDGLDSAAVIRFVNDVRQWQAGVNALDQFQIRDNTSPATRFVIDTTGQVYVYDDIVLGTDDTWIGRGSTSLRIVFDTSGHQLHFYGDDNTEWARLYETTIAGDDFVYWRLDPSQTEDVIGILLGGSVELRCWTATDHFQLYTSGSADIIFDPDGLVFIGVFDDATYVSNSNTTNGLVINQGGAGDEIFTLKATGVAHGATTIAGTQGTDTFGVIRQVSPAAGGMTLLGLRDSADIALALQGAIAGNADTGKTASDVGIVSVYGGQISGTDWADVVANGNVFSVLARVSSAWRTVFIVDEDGDLHVDGSGTLSTFDAYTDAHLVRALDLARGPGEVVRSQWDRFVGYNEDKLVELGILGAPLNDGGLINVTRLQQLHNGAIWQNYVAIQELVEKLEAVISSLKALGIDPTALLVGNN